MQDSSKGLLSAVSAFTLWGLLPLYLKVLAPATPTEILCHRIIWSAIATISLLFIGKKAGKLLFSLRKGKIILPFLITSTLISINWLTYIWAVNNGHIVEASLGYYINPLINILLGMIFLKERLRPYQWLAIFFAFSGVCYLTFCHGHFPWIALILGFSFSFYGLTRKITPVPSLEGLCIETALLSIPATAVILYIAYQGNLDFIHQDLTGRLLLAGTGIITSLPLLLFGFAAQRIQLSTLGLVQYLAPTLQLGIGVLVFNETFTESRAISFSLVWFGLLIYLAEGLMLRFRQKKACTAPL